MDWWNAGEQRPDRVTALSMDAPTETQFDVPVQKRQSRDPVKALDGAKKWSSKITGLMIAGLGMLTFITRDGLGSGPGPTPPSPQPTSVMLPPFFAIISQPNGIM